MALLNQRLLKIQVPDFIQRRPRTLVEHAHWKASEYREWLIHFSVPVISGILKPLPFVHFLLLVTALSLLTKENMTLEDVNCAEYLLVDFCRIYPSIYGLSSQTMNVHLLRHLANFTRMYGPLFCFSCFGFESMNSFMKKMVHGTRHINNQISFAVLMSKQLGTLMKHWTEQAVDPVIRDLALHLGSKFTVEDHHQISGLVPLGKLKRIDETSELYNLLTPEMKRQNLFVFTRLKKGNIVFYGNQYRQTKTRNSCTVAFHDGAAEKCGTIRCFVKVGEIIYTCIEECETSPFRLDIVTRKTLQSTCLEEYQSMSLCPHMVEVKEKISRLTLVHFADVIKKCILMDIRQGLAIISKPPNLLEHN